MIIFLAIVSTDKPKTEASTEPLVISSAPEALPLPELTITISDEPAREPFAAYGARKYIRTHSMKNAPRFIHFALIHSNHS